MSLAFNGATECLTSAGSCFVDRFVGVLVHRPDMFRRYSSLIYLSANTLEAMAMATALRSKVFHKPVSFSLSGRRATDTASGIERAQVHLRTPSKR